MRRRRHWLEALVEKAVESAFSPTISIKSELEAAELESVYRPIWAKFGPDDEALLHLVRRLCLLGSPEK